VHPAFASLLSYKRFNTRGISQLAINGTNVGAALDQYAATDSYATDDYAPSRFPPPATIPSSLPSRQKR
jgi:hypothetical protein